MIELQRTVTSLKVSNKSPYDSFEILIDEVGDLLIDNDSGSLYVVTKDDLPEFMKALNDLVSSNS